MNVSDFVIEKGIPTPERKAQQTRYPFPQMDVGDSFVVPQEVIENVRMAASQAARRKGLKFATRRIDAAHYRVWRLA
jgi:hypothetical protein